MIDPKRIESDLEEHGELHLVVEEHESVLADSDEEYIGLRLGSTDFDHDANVIRSDDGTKEHIIDSQRVVYYHKPNEFPD